MKLSSFKKGHAYNRIDPYHLYIYRTCMYSLNVCVCVCVCVFIYIYIYRERPITFYIKHLLAQIYIFICLIVKIALCDEQAKM